MPALRARLLATVLLALPAQALPVRAEPPQPARGRFVSRSYAVTFTAPAGLAYCRLPDGWTGSDHGTTLFLVPPRSCGGAGYPSSARGFSPDVPRVELYYGRSSLDGAAYPCHVAGHLVLLGRRHPVCADSANGTAVRHVTGLYVSDGPADLVLTLLTTQARLHRDTPVLRAIAAAMQVCAIPWRDAQGRTRTMGSGHPCPESGDFY